MHAIPKAQKSSDGKVSHLEKELAHEKQVAKDQAQRHELQSKLLTGGLYRRLDGGLL